MGVFYVACELVNVRRPSKSGRVAKMLVDSGSEFSRIPETTLRRMDVPPAKKGQVFVMANGRTITRSTGYVILRVGEFETVDEVVFGEPGDLTILGSRTLEGFGAVVDARRKRLVAAGPYLAAP